MKVYHKMRMCESFMSAIRLLVVEPHKPFFHLHQCKLHLDKYNSFGWSIFITLYSITCNVLYKVFNTTRNALDASTVCCTWEEQGTHRHLKEHVYKQLFFF